MSQPKISIIMGSDSDLSVLQQAADVIKSFNVPFEITIVSAHRTPEKLFDIYFHSVGILGMSGGIVHVQLLLDNLKTFFL